MMLHTLPHPHPHYQKLALASQLTPPPSPECNLKPVEDAKPRANQGRLRRARLPEPLMLVDSSYGSSHGSDTVAVQDKMEQKQLMPEIKRDITFLDPTRNSSLAGSMAEPVSPMSCAYSDLRGSFDVSRPSSVHLDTPPTLASSNSSFSPIPEQETRDITKEIPIIPKDNVADMLHLSPQQRQEYLPLPLFAHDQKQTVKPFLSRLDTKCEPVQRQQRPLPVYEKALPPPPRSETPSPKTIPSEPFPPFDAVTVESRFPLQSDQVMTLSQSLNGLGLDKPSRGYFSPTESTPRRPVPPASAAFSGVESTLRKVQPTYTVTVSAPRLNRRFSKLSRRSRDAEFPKDPLEPVSMIPQKTNGVETGAMAYLPRYTNTFAGFCKNAWRLQIGEWDKALNVRNRNSASYPPSIKCRKCSFEGPLHPAPARRGRFVGKKIPNARIYTSYGVSYSWQFLFKSHVALKTKPRKDADCELNDGLFACIFCCASGKDTPVYKGPDALAWHLRGHAGEGESLDPELKVRYKIILGREPDEAEDFDVLIPPLGSALEDDISP